MFNMNKIDAVLDLQWKKQEKDSKHVGIFGGQCTSCVIPTYFF